MTVLLRASLADRIAAIVQERIVAGDYPAEAPLRQDELAAEFGVSKIPVREAFAKLEQAGLVASQLNRGFFVRPLSLDEAFDVFNLRLRIEPDAAARAAGRASEADIAFAASALDAVNAAVSQANGPVGPLNRAFHMALVRPVAAPISRQMLERLHVISERYVARHLKPAGRSVRAEREHQALFDAWSAGRCAEVEQLSHQHIATTWADLKGEIEATAA